MATPVQVIIVGAGLSGLRAAKELQDGGISYLVFESMDRVGGRTLSMPTKENGRAPVDLGAAWINDTAQTEMYSMARAFGLTLEEQRHDGTSVYQDSFGKLTSMPYGMETGVHITVPLHRITPLMTFYSSRLNRPAKRKVPWSRLWSTLSVGTLKTQS
jgi:monoamine oxidase